jgi:hypothetical protein
MKRLFAWAAVALLSLFSLQSMAATKILGGPAPGLWWNPNESGRGYNFDLQGNLLVMTSYVYNQQGAPVWYLAVGTYNYTNGQMSATFDGATNGQCLGCSYKAPVGQANVAGAMKVVFDNATSGTLYFAGGSTHIERQIFGFSDLNAFLFGELQMGYNAGGVVGGDWFLFNKNYTASDGTKYIAGNLDGCTSCTVLGRYDPTLKAWTMINKVGSYYTFYDVNMDDRRVVGLSWIYQTTLSGSGTVSLGSRVLAQAELVAALAAKPGQAALRSTASDAEYIANREQALAKMMALQAKDATSVPAGMAALNAQMRAELDKL